MAGILRDGTSADAIVNETDTGLDVLIRPHKRFELTLAIREALIALAESADMARVSWGDRATAEPVVVRRTPLLVLGDASVELPPGAFLQATKRAELVMRGRCHAPGPARARTSPICSPASARCRWASRARSSLFESDKPAVAAVDAAARKLGGNRVTVHLRDLFRNPLTVERTRSLRRRGAGSAARRRRRAMRANWHRSKVKRVVYGSCDPGSFARDVRTLQDGGYRLEKLMPIDQFLWSAHVELIALLTK